MIIKLNLIHLQIKLIYIYIYAVYHFPVYLFRSRENVVVLHYCFETLDTYEKCLWKRNLFLPFLISVIL
jgi:hypothetical protein